MDLEQLPLNSVEAALAWKLFGSSVEYLGGRIRDYTEIAERNVARVVSKAIRKVGSDALTQEARVPPRVMQKVLEESAFAEDEILAEYLGGILASSRGAKDDIGVALLSTISRLSSHTIRTHFLLYRAAIEAIIRTEGGGAGFNSFFVVDFSEYLVAQQVYDADSENYATAARERGDPPIDLQFIARAVWHTFQALERELLLGKMWGLVAEETFQRDVSGTTVVIYQMSQSGAELFQSALGMPDPPFRTFVERLSNRPIGSELPQVEARVLPRERAAEFQLVQEGLSIEAAKELLRDRGPRGGASSDPQHTTPG